MKISLCDIIYLYLPVVNILVCIFLDVGKTDEHHSPNHPPFERSASTGDNPDFLDDDIDSFIATMMIPPPPDTVIPANDKLSNSLQFQYDEEESQMYNGAESLISSDELLSSLVIPPPPGDASESIDEIKIVPPVETETNMSTHSNKSHKHYKHRRSSSLDVSSLRVFSDSQNEIESQTKNSPKSCDLNVVPPKSLSHETDSQSTKDFESPATVSEKLNILLQSMPSFGSGLSESDMKFRRASSLRLGKSASFEVLASPTTEEVTTESKKVGRSNSFQVHLQAKPQEQPPKKNGSTYISPKKNRPIEPAVKKEVSASQEKSVQNSNYSRHLRRTHSFDIIPNKDDEKTAPEKTGGDNFASLKEKLKSYRDYLLSKSDKTKHRKSSLVSNDNASQNEQSSPLKRSNSFTFNWLKRRSNSFDSGDTSKISGSDSSLSSKPSDSSKENEDSSNKKVPQVLNTLSVPRSTFKPHSSLSIQVRIHISCHYRI
jgi:hypothetical protein